MGGAVKEGAVLATLLEVALGFEDVHHGHDGGVSDLAAVEEGFVNIADGGGTALPDELHDFELLGGKRIVFRSHSKLLVLINSYVKRKVAAERAQTSGTSGRLQDAGKAVARRRCREDPALRGMARQTGFVRFFVLNKRTANQEKKNGSEDPPLQGHEGADDAEEI